MKLKFLTLISACVMASLSMGQAITFTGNVANDFPATALLADPGGITDVGLPANLIGALSGWEMIQVAMSYDNASDTMFLGIDCRGICGDADGDGNPGGTSMALAANGGADLPNFGGTESFTFGFDLNNDGQLDIICGTPLNSDLSGYTVATFSPFANLFAPFFGFMTPLPSNTGTVFASPSAGAPDLEFTITNFSALVATYAMPGQTGFGVHVFMGSLADDGIGEDYFPSTVTAEVPPSFLECFPIPNFYEIIDGPTTNMMTGVTTFTTRYGLPLNYGCCVMFSLFTQNPGFILTNLGGMPEINVGLASDLIGTIGLIDLGIPPQIAAVACKDQTWDVPPGLASGTKVNLQIFAYPNAIPFNPALTFFTSNVICYTQP